MILGIIFPPLILLLDFRLGDDSSFHAPGGKVEGKEKEDDTKSSKVFHSFMMFMCHFLPKDAELSTYTRPVVGPQPGCNFQEGR